MTRFLARPLTLGNAELRWLAEEGYGMGMPEPVRTWTREMVLELPEDGNRYELFDGELLVTPAPTGPHQVGLTRFYDVIAPFVRAHQLGEPLWSPADLRLGGEQLAQPDLFVVPYFPPGLDWREFPDPILIVEVLSASSARFDRTIKRRRFQRAGIPEYWIVDLDARVVERWRPADERPEIVDERLLWSPAGVASPLLIDLPPLFTSIWGS